jgi:hypothetical protein
MAVQIVDKHRNKASVRDHLAQQAKLLCFQDRRSRHQTRDIAARPVEAGDQTGFHRVTACIDQDGDRRRCSLRRQCSNFTAARDDHPRTELNQLGG